MFTVCPSDKRSEARQDVVVESADKRSAEHIGWMHTEVIMRNFFSWLLARAPREDSEPPTVHLSVAIFAPPPIDVLQQADELDDADVDFAEFSEGSGQRKERKDDGLKDVEHIEHIELNDLFCIIEYSNSSGVTTRRRVTMRRMYRGPNSSIVLAVCHERRASRTFRADRIRYVLSDQGEVIEPFLFFQEHFGSSASEMLRASGLRPNERPSGTKMRELPTLIEAARPAIMVLVCAARVDAEFHLAELDAIESYLENEGVKLAREGIIAEPPSLDELTTMAAMVRRMRPQARSLWRHIEQLAMWDEQRLLRLSSAVQKVVGADGKITTQEHDFVADLRQTALASLHERERIFGASGIDAKAIFKNSPMEA